MQQHQNGRKWQMHTRWDNGDPDNEDLDNGDPNNGDLDNGDPDNGNPMYL
jgi:chitinase